MKLIVPRVDNIDPTDERLMRLAQFLGIPCEILALQPGTQNPVHDLDSSSSDSNDCLVVNPRTVKEWMGGTCRNDLFQAIASRFQGVLVHSVAPDAFSENLISTLTMGAVQSAEPVTANDACYEIAPDMRTLCESFSGLSFGPANPANDFTFRVDSDNADVQTPISIGGSPFMALVKRDKTTILVIGSADVVDLNEEVCEGSWTQRFSQFVPHAMTLRYIFGEQSWRPSGQYACFIVDDPLLRPKYGYLDFGSLLNLMEEYNFSTTIAFIPHNYRRNSSRTLEMFRQNNGRLSICFHGNDHTGGELASTDASRLNTILRTAKARMDALESATGLVCRRVMVFPQDDFSLEAMKVLRSRNFYAAVGGKAHPVGPVVQNLTVGEEAQPAILRHGQFPLFMRSFVGHVKKQDVAFNLFFGRTVFITEHHELFGKVKSLVEDVLMINSMQPDIRWCDIETAVMNSTLRRTTSDGVCHVRAYSRTVRITNDSDSPARFLVEWSHSGDCPQIEPVLENSGPIESLAAGDSTIHVALELAPGGCQTVSLVQRSDHTGVEPLGLLWTVKAFIRRRLSEARDNYISKNQFALSVAQALTRRVFSKVF